MSISPRFMLGDLDLTDAPFAVEFGTDLGNPENASEVIASLLQDGELVASTRTSNRTITLPILIDDSDLLALAEAQAALDLEANKARNVLSVDPGDGIAPLTLFDTFRAQVNFRRDDDEEQSGVRRCTLTIPALPFGRSVDEVIETAATATGGADTQVNACDATTGWTATGGTLSIDTTYKAEGTGALKLSAGSATFEKVDGGASYRVTQAGTLTLSGLSLNLSTTPFLAVKVWTRYSESTTVTCLVDGNPAALASSRTSSAANGPWTTFYFYSNDTAVSSIAFSVSQTATFPADPSLANTWLAPSSPDWNIRIDDVRRSGSAPTSPNSGKERTLLIPVQGAARTQGSLSIQHETAGLGDVLIYTNPLLSPTGYTPDLTRWTVSYSAQAADVSYLSGFQTTLNVSTPWRIEIPAAAFPHGGYELLAYMQCGAGKVVTIDVSIIIGGTTVSTQTITSPPLEGGTAHWQSLGWAMLPPNDLPPGSLATVRLDVKYPDSAASSALVQEILALKCDDNSSVTRVNCGGTGTPTLGSANNRLWVKAPTLTNPIPSVTMGTKADETDSYNAGASVKPMGRHNFVPPYVLAFVANTGGANPTITYRHPKCWPTHAAS